MDQKNDQQLTKTLSSVPTSRQGEVLTQRKQIAAILARLSLHYWRPDFTTEQGKLVMDDYLMDLANFTPTEVERACMEYRRKPGSEFFPKISQLLEILRPAKPAWDGQPRSCLPRYERSQFMLSGPKPKLKSVGDVLRQHGYAAAAEQWEARKC